jgi:hypothetical protein
LITRASSTKQSQAEQNHGNSSLINTLLSQQDASKMDGNVLPMADAGHRP